MPRSREEILEKYKGCSEQLGRAPGLGALEKITGIKRSEIDYYWPRLADLAREAGLTPNFLSTAIPEDQLLAAYAGICLDLKKVPSTNELRIAIRDQGSFSKPTFMRPYGGSIVALQKRFREWIHNEHSEYSEILNYTGWSQAKREPSVSSTSIPPSYESSPFLPAVLQELDRLSRGEKPFFHSDESISTAFERRCADAFRCLGFEVTDLDKAAVEKRIA